MKRLRTGTPAMPREDVEDDKRLCCWRDRRCHQYWHQVVKAVGFSHGVKRERRLVQERRINNTNVKIQINLVFHPTFRNFAANYKLNGMNDES